MSRASNNDPANRARWRTAWDKQASTYDRQMRFFDRKLFKDSRHWVCSQAAGEILEVAIGTGLNLEHYPPGTRLTGIELSQAMLQLARDRPTDLDVDLREGDAHRLDFADNSFDTVVCTFSLCAIPDHRSAIKEMHRVLRPGGLLLLADHVASPNVLVRAVQRLAEVVTVRMAGEHFRRRPVEIVEAEGLLIEQRERFGMGLVERCAARKPN